MIDVCFDDSTNTFVCKAEDSGTEYRLEYFQPFPANITLSDYRVDLLINPYLNRESNIYSLQDKNQRVGYIFPISVLVSSEDLSDYKGLDRHIYAAFHVLLERLPQIISERDFLKNFEDNIIVAVFDYQKLSNPSRYPIDACIHSLRKHGYSYFIDNNTIKQVPFFDVSFYTPESNRINLKFTPPPLYKERIIDTILREYPKLSNATHRFIILYQVIEYLMEIVTHEEIKEFILKYNNGMIPINDFTNDLKSIAPEKSKIKKIFDNSRIKDTDVEGFINRYHTLRTLINYHPSAKTYGEWFYTFRNLLFHRYRTLHIFEKELAETVQCAEQVILTIIEKFETE